MSALALCATILLGAVGFSSIGGTRWSFGECLYMSLISATTVGYGETLPGMEQVPLARIWACIVILLGVAVFGIAASMLTAFIVESDLHSVFRKKAMRKHIEALNGHVIVCGIGSTGGHVLREMLVTKTPVVVIEIDPARTQAMAASVAPTELLFITGDATDDAILEEAGIRRASGLVCALPDDKDNLFVVVSARGLNQKIRIVTRGHDPRTADKLRKAGAHAVVSPNFIGGMRLASEVLRPNVVEFLDVMLRDRQAALRLEEVVVTPGSPLVGKTLASSGIRGASSVLVLAIRAPETRAFAFNPMADTEIIVGSTLVVMGNVDEVIKLRSFVNPE